MTAAAPSATPSEVGRKKEYSERIVLPLKPKELAAIDTARRPGEARTELIREAVEREIKRRSRTQSPKP